MRRLVDNFVELVYSFQVDTVLGIESRTQAW